jgi:hypothetical protein
MLEKIIRKIDDLFLGKAIQRQYSKLLTAKVMARFEPGFDFKIVSYYKKNATCEISRLCDVYGSDKGEISIGPHPYPWPSHTYADFYSRLFWHCRDGVRNVFECGLGTNKPGLPSSMGISGKPGASLRVWRDFFPNAMIYGADIDRDVLFEEDRIKTFYIDQLNPDAIKSFWKIVGTSDLDFMVDDGLHTFESGSTLFVHSIDRLAQNGIYVIEDVGPADLLRYKDFFKNKDYTVEYVCLYRPSMPLSDNSLVVIRKNGKR